MQKNPKNNHMDFLHGIANVVLLVAEGILEGLLKAAFVLGVMIALIYVLGVVL